MELKRNTKHNGIVTCEEHLFTLGELLSLLCSVHRMAMKLCFILCYDYRLIALATGTHPYYT